MVTSPLIGTVCLNVTPLIACVASHVFTPITIDTPKYERASFLSTLKLKKRCFNVNS